MNDQTIPADKVEKIATAMRAAIRRDEHTYPEAKFLADLSGYINDLEALLPDRPTMADMPEEERPACQWMQCDAGPAGRRGVITNAEDWHVYVVDQETGVHSNYSPDLVTPRPDLPPLPWPGTEKPAPAPALPDGWRLADHKKHGRVIVTNTTPSRGGHVYYVFPDDGAPMGFDWLFGDPDYLTYIDQGADQ